MGWFSAGVQVNPATDAILADTGALPDTGHGAIKIVLGATVIAVCSIEHRNAANNANLHSQAIACPVNGVFNIDLPGLDWAAGER
jgi:hypothetical protein